MSIYNALYTEYNFKMNTLAILTVIENAKREPVPHI